VQEVIIARVEQHRQHCIHVLLAPTLTLIRLCHPALAPQLLQASPRKLAALLQHSPCVKLEATAPLEPLTARIYLARLELTPITPGSGQAMAARLARREAGVLEARASSVATVHQDTTVLMKPFSPNNILALLGNIPHLDICMMRVNALIANLDIIVQLHQRQCLDVLVEAIRSIITRNRPAQMCSLNVQHVPQVITALITVQVRYHAVLVTTLILSQHHAQFASEGTTVGAIPPPYMT